MWINSKQKIWFCWCDFAHAWFWDPRSDPSRSGENSWRKKSWVLCTFTGYQLNDCRNMSKSWLFIKENSNSGAWRPLTSTSGDARRQKRLESCFQETATANRAKFSQISSDMNMKLRTSRFSRRDEQKDGNKCRVLVFLVLFGSLAKHKLKKKVVFRPSRVWQCRICRCESVLRHTLLR